MAADLRGGGDQDREMRYHSSSPNSLSSPPSSSISNPASPSRLQAGRANIEMDEIVVDTASGPRFGVMQPPQPPGPEVQLTAAGLPRKKPGRKPGSVVKPKVAADGSSTTTPGGPDAPPKAKRTRKPKDPNAPPAPPRKRKIAATQETSVVPVLKEQPPPLSEIGPASRQAKIIDYTTQMDVDMRTPLPSNNQHLSDLHPNKVLKRDAVTSMRSILNDDPSPAPPLPSAPMRMSGMAFDPVRSSSASYDPVRETMVNRDPYGTAGMASPRGPPQMTNRASASPSISSLVDPPVPTMISPSPSHSTFHNTTQSRFQEPTSLPASPSNAARREPLPSSGTAPKSLTTEIKKSAPPPPMLAPPKAVEPPKPSMMTTISGLAPPSMSAPSRKLAAVAAQSRKDRKDKKASSSSSSPKMTSLKNALPDIPPLAGSGNERSILDFGKAGPGEEFSAPTIVLHIPLAKGETNKYINFMRLAEETYGWDALHPRLAATRERKARIAAASAALEKQATGRGEASGPEASARSEDEMSVDLQSDAENSNIEMGGMGNGGTSGPDGVPVKPARKKRNFKEDEYDREDDFVDDSEMLWEEQAAASKDGFFVYSGPLVPAEPDKPAAGSDGPPKRGRGGRRGGGPGSRGGRVPGEGGTRRGGGPGSRGGAVARKPRITKLAKANLEREKAEREQLAQMTSKNVTGYSLMQGPAGPTFQAGMAVDG